MSYRNSRLVLEVDDAPFTIPDGSKYDGNDSALVSN